VIDESDSQNEKHSEPRISTLRGIRIDESDDLENAFNSIRVKCESDSNVTDESDLQHEKHSGPRVSTLRGIMIDESDDSRNANDSIRVKCEFASNIMHCSQRQGHSRETIDVGIQHCQIEALSGVENGTR
jgi:hypothetical protein